AGGAQVSPDAAQQAAQRADMTRSTSQLGGGAGQVAPCAAPAPTSMAQAPATLRHPLVPLTFNPAFNAGS
ncbi:MAG: hypothetical protein V4739_10260, partial [Pseudomonadota bacterium]